MTEGALREQRGSSSAGLRHVRYKPLQKTPLHAAHSALLAKLVPFAGYDMPVQYPSGI